jgi:curved DNA-binding protein CbpA
LDAGEISRSDAARLAQYVEHEGCPEAKALLDLRLLEPRHLFLALKQQLRSRLIECFGWAEGAFTIEAGDAPGEEAEPFRADLYPLLQEGIEAHWSSERILGDLTPHMNQLAKRGALASRIRGRLRSDAAVAAFLDALDGSRTLWKALQSATTPRALAAAWLLDAIQAIEYTAAPDGEVPLDFEIVFGDDAEDDLEDRAARAEAASRASAQGGSRGPAGAALRRHIAEKFARLEELDHYALLDVPAGANAAAIKRAYLKAAKYYHPDALARLQIESEVRDQANKVFARIGKAYAVLSSPDRGRYDASLAGDEPGIDAEQIATAETLYRKGEILLKLGNFKGAIEFLAPAVEIYPEEADYQNALGWALYKKHPSEPERAKVHLERAAELSRDDGTVLFRLGFVLRSLGESGAAADLLARARETKPGAG